MSVLTSRPVLRWLVPAAATVAVIGGGAAIGAITAAADPTLPARSAAQLLVDVQTAELDGLSGTVVVKMDLGLPAINLGGSGNLSSLLAGTHTLRVWYSGPDKARLALLDTLGETDLIANGTDLWTWDSRANTATHQTIPQSDHKSGTPDVGPTGKLTPQQIADLALAAISPTTEVTTQGTASIAGRDAYELVLSPKDPQSLIGSVRIAIDAQAHLPLRVQIFGRTGDTPAVEVGFTQVSFARPDAQEFTFNPPPGAKVTEGGTSSGGGGLGFLLPDGAGMPSVAGKGRTAVVGKGWTSVLVYKTSALAGDSGNGRERGPQAIMQALPAVSGSWGSGHLLAGPLFSALLTDDGRLLVGAVTPDRLYAAAADPAAKLTG
jgi:outer membrane lipoprotein-sorting protein